MVKVFPIGTRVYVEFIDDLPRPYTRWGSSIEAGKTPPGLYDTDFDVIKMKKNGKYVADFEMFRSADGLGSVKFPFFEEEFDDEYEAARCINQFYEDMGLPRNFLVLFFLRRIPIFQFDV